MAGKRSGNDSDRYVQPNKERGGWDVVKEGQAVKVKLLGFDDRGKVRLSMKQVDQTTGEDLSGKKAPAEA